MTRKYEATIVLDTKGKEQSIEELVGQISKTLETSGARLEQVDQMGKREFPFSPRHVTHGYFVNVKFEAEPTVLDTVSAKLKLNDNVYQQYYQRCD
ncbi:MAG: 30S ribosomal protein S6 [Verrucomicrobiaceae bacterium]|jgi:small subunit ribosomal protein S6|nr:30S ribosomal protein S6 [Verrucomicrobiaceae bacterium]